MKTDDSSPSGDNVINLSVFRQKKSAEQEFGRGRSPLYMSHLTGKVTGSLKDPKQAGADFGDRLQRIRASLDKINRLMSELKKIGSMDDFGQKSQPTTPRPPTKERT